jgi:tetratricopeptide (TPR) repeat protein
LGSDHPLVAWGYNNLGLCYTELGLHSDALTSLNAALERRKKNDISCIGNSYSNLASLHLKMGKLEEAEQYLFSCPSLQNLTDDLLLSKGNPRFAGDMVLLSRMRRAQGRIDDALRLASKALIYRRRLLGNRFTTCDSMHDVASLLMEDGTTYGTALSVLQELVSITEGFVSVSGQGQLARAYHRLAVLYGRLDDNTKSETYKEKALTLARKLSPDTHEVDPEEMIFAKFCPWMLW